MARWSHKHLAHLVNLGRFGIHHMMMVGFDVIDMVRDRDMRTTFVVRVGVEDFRNLIARK